MQKLLALIFTFMFFAVVSPADAKVCFLPGVLSGDGCLNEEELTRCNGFERTSPCPSGYEQASCVDGGTTYYHCACRNDNILVLGTTYKCEGKFDSACGCAAKDTVCNTNLFPYQGCGDYEGSVPSSNSCRSPKDGKIYYKSCDCPKGVYPYDCRAVGLKTPGNASVCEDTSGQKRYSFCFCDDGWSTTACANRGDGCTNMVDSVYSGLGTCYNCGEEVCPVGGNVNLDARWCDISQTTKTNCAELGYTYAPSGKCLDGSVGLKCPFDDAYIFCAGGGSQGNTCKYTGKAACESSNAGFVCSESSEGCFEPLSCAVGYIKQDQRLTLSHVYEAHTADGLTCYKPKGCMPSFSTINTGLCREYDSAGYKCYDCSTIVVPQKCEAGYAKVVADCGKTGSTGWSLLAPEEGKGDCRKCFAKLCTALYDEAQCAYSPATGELLPGLSVCYSGDTPKCKPSNVSCCDRGFSYDCAGTCSDSPTMGGVLCRQCSSVGGGGDLPVIKSCCDRGFACECSGVCSNSCDPMSCAICFRPNS